MLVAITLHIYYYYTYNIIGGAMGQRSRAMSEATVSVLRAITEGSSYGFDVMDATGLPSGTVYPILSRMEKRGLVVSRWENPEAEREAGRPPRRFYTLTREGRAALATAMQRFRTLGQPLAAGGPRER